MANMHVCVLCVVCPCLCLLTHRVLVHLYYELFDSVQRGVGPGRGILPVAIQVEAHQRTPVQTHTKHIENEVIPRGAVDHY